MAGIIVGAAAIGAAGSAYAANQAGNAAEDAARAQGAAAADAAQLQQAQFNRVRNLLNPYVQAGSNQFDTQAYLRANPDVAANPFWAANAEQHFLQYGATENRQPFYTSGGALQGQQALLGLQGPEAQQAAISGIEKSPYFQGLVQQGENALLQNASATGGLRGGNTAAALAQFRPNMLAAAIDQQYQRLGGLVSLGQNAAAGVGNAGLASANAQGQLLQQAGAAQAGGILGQARANVAGVQGIASAFGTAAPSIAGYFNQQPGITQYGGTPMGGGYGQTAGGLNNNFGGGQVANFF